MSISSPLYKFASAEGARKILEGGELWTQSPVGFNDPFEALPAFDEERKNEAVFSRREFYNRIGMPFGADLVKGGNEENIPVENWVDLSAVYHDCHFETLYENFRVLCFSKDVTPILLWSHYADSHQGVAIGFDLSADTFPHGVVPDGFAVGYSPDRADLKLPLEYYRHAALKAMDGQLANLSGYTKTHGGIIISAAEEERIYLDCLVRMLSTKFDAWEYEEEHRFLYDLRKGELPDAKSADRQVARFSHESVSDLVFGYRTSMEEIISFEPLLSALPNATLHYVDFHPEKYMVRIWDGDLEQVLATHHRRMQSSFRGR